MKNKLTPIWLIGDTGAVNPDGTDPVLQALAKELKENPDGILIFLGDLLYPKGMPEPNHPDRLRAELVIRSQTDIVKNYPGKVYFLSGNHDWKKGRIGGWKYVKRLEDFIEKQMGKQGLCLPVQPGPGPELTEPYPGIFLIILNTQWWMQPGKRKEFRAEKFFLELYQILEKLPPERTLICGHHPVRSHSLHGGKFKKKHHLFPLRLYGFKFSPPIPVFGSLLVLYRKFWGAKEDMSHSRYADFKKKILHTLEQFPGITYVSGHEHNLQWIFRNHVNHIISGAGSKAYYVRKGKDTVFCSNKKGFIRLDLGENSIQYFSSFEWNPEQKAVIKTYTKDWHLHLNPDTISTPL